MVKLEQRFGGLQAIAFKVVDATFPEMTIIIKKKKNRY